MECAAIRKTTSGSKKVKVTGWDIQPGIGKDACTQFEVILSDGSQAKDPPWSTRCRCSRFRGYCEWDLRLVDHKLHIVLRAVDGVEWSTSLESDSNQLIVPAQQAQLAELFIALCVACQNRFGAAALQLRAESPGPHVFAAPFCEVGGLPCRDRDDTCFELCRASDQSWSILSPDNILWWTREITQEAPQRKHPKPANWGGIQDARRNYKSLKESKKRASMLPPVDLTEAPRVHGSVMKFAQSGKPNGNTINPLRLIHVQTRDMIATAELETKRYAAISYTWSQVSKAKLLESATTRAKELGYEYIWIDQYCIDQTNRQERNAEIKRMR
ncbi:predicted protein [Aspergillus nidulans FGSC A4]|nr:predicted protein [Aspergillus nidulans FGSC A4]|eukprot:XP_659321.1 predicted protein [Aspergillus nidulans FGSC A4]